MHKKLESALFEAINKDKNINETFELNEIQILHHDGSNFNIRNGRIEILDDILYKKLKRKPMRFSYGMNFK